MGLFPPSIRKDASLSACGTYRWMLTRSWSTGQSLVYIMLNPSTADAWADDPTIKSCMLFARSHQYTGITVVNLFAYRATDPNTLKMFDKGVVVGGANDANIRLVLENQKSVCVAWGNHGTLHHRDQEVLALVQQHTSSIFCLGKNAGGTPRHPLYLRSDTKLIPYL